jgi:hypothetical protein
LDAAGGRKFALDHAARPLPRQARGGATRRVAFGKACREAEDAVAGAGAGDVLRGSAGHEHLPRLVEDQLAARLREQMQRRRPAARRQHDVAGERLRLADGAVRAKLRDRSRGDAKPAGRAGDNASEPHR